MAKRNFFKLKKNKTLLAKLLLIEVFMFVFLVGFLPEPWHKMAYTSLYAALFYTCALNLAKYEKMLWIATVPFVLQWSAAYFDFHILNAASKILSIFFFIFVVIVLINQISKARNVNEIVILEAIIGYLLLGIVFSLLISLMVQFDPYAYNFSASGELKLYDVVYYGFVTLSTLGYGDLLPLSPHSKSLALITTIGGQLYIAVIIALLVGKYSSRRND